MIVEAPPINSTLEIVEAASREQFVEHDDFEPAWFDPEEEGC